MITFELFYLKSNLLSQILLLYTDIIDYSIDLNLKYMFEKHSSMPFNIANKIDISHAQN